MIGFGSGNINRNLLLCSSIAFLLIISTCQASSVTRSISKTSVSPGEVISVSLTVSIAPTSDTYYAVEDTYPFNWTITNNGGGDTNQTYPSSPNRSVIKFVMIDNAVDTTYTYMIKANSTAGTYTFSGQYEFNSTLLNPISPPISGPSQVTVAGCTQIFYGDADSDTYGNLSNTTQACTAPSGYVSSNTDCDDTKSAVHPGATEICLNALDDDCSGAGDPDCPGDIANSTGNTPDRCIDMFDLTAIGHDFGKTSGFINPRADITGNSLVDIYDLVYVGKDFGKCPG